MQPLAPGWTQLQAGTGYRPLLLSRYLELCTSAGVPELEQGRVRQVGVSRVGGSLQGLVTHVEVDQERHGSPRLLLQGQQLGSDVTLQVLQWVTGPKYSPAPDQTDAVCLLCYCEELRSGGKQCNTLPEQSRI